MKNFCELLNILDKLLSENGCPWDKKQTLTSLRPFFIEEAHELVDAIDDGNKEAIIEEAGDLLHTVLFLSKIAENNKIFNISDVIDAIKQKLIRRHPHIFGECKAENEREVISLWQEAKAKEISKKVKYNSLPLLEQVQKFLRKSKGVSLSRKNFSDIEDEESLGEAFFELIKVAEEKGLNANLALLKFFKSKNAGEGLEA